MALYLQFINSKILGGIMTLFTFVGGLVIFALLVLLVPRTSFMVLLGIYNLRIASHLFPSTPGTNWETLATVVFGLSTIIALILDVATLSALKDKWDDL